MVRLCENTSKIMFNQHYTEGVISLLEKHVHPQTSSPHSDAVRGGSLVTTTFLITDRHLRCCYPATLAIILGNNLGRTLGVPSEKSILPIFHSVADMSHVQK